MISTTLRRILEAEPCYDPRERGLLPADQDLDAPISFRDIVDKVGPEDAIWCFSILPGNEGLKRHFSVDCAERVKHLMKNERSLNVLTVARRHAIGQATDEELAAASAASSAAALDSASAASSAASSAAAWAAAWAAACDLAWAVAKAAAWAAAWSAARSAAGAAAWDSAWDSAWAVAIDSDSGDERAWQAARLIELTEAGEWSPVKPFG